MFTLYRFRSCLVVAACALGLSAPASIYAQELTEDMVGQTEQSWIAWKAAMRSIDRDELSEAATQLDAIRAMNLSDLRLALMAERTGSSRLEQWAAAADSPASAQELVAQITNGRKQLELAEDGWHYAAIGRFGYADASFKALIESSPDPVALLELARRNPQRHEILIKLLTNADVGASAKEFLDLLTRGEELLRTDPYEIVTNIAKLGGPPRMVYNATNRLKDSGEYAIPHLIRALQDSNRASLHPAIVQVIPKIGHAGLNPLCQALGIKDDVTRTILIRALAEIGYKQPAPYLAKLAQNENEPPQIRAEAAQALSALGVGEADVSGLFTQLADLYYNNTESLKADPRSDMANIWYLREGELRYIPVPREIFNDVMCMRSAEEALLADPDRTPATAVWLAANYRREARLGMDVESDQASPLAIKDSTRPDNYPRSIYFGRAAGAQYNHMVLARGYRDTDPGVALGAIAALRETGGASDLVGAEDVKQPLVQTLSFPSRQVRFKAAEAIAASLPKSSFAGSELVIPVLGEVLLQSDRRSALVVDVDPDMLNKFQTILRSSGFDTGAGDNLFTALQNAKDANLVSFDVILLSSDLTQPDTEASVRELRNRFETAATPILIVAKPDGIGIANRLARENKGIEVLLSDVIDMGDVDRINDMLLGRVARASQAMGMTPLDRDMALDLAIRSADVLRKVAESGQTVFDVNRAEGALLGALKSASETLRMRVARALALVSTADAQTALAESALDTGKSGTERIAAFGDLAESARRNGNLLGERDVVSRLIEFTMKEQDLILRAAASKSLGALNLSSNKASEIIRAQYNG